MEDEDSYKQYPLIISLIVIGLMMLVSMFLG